MGNSLNTTYVPSWQDACTAKFNCTSTDLVDFSGAPIAPVCPADGSMPSIVWGITARACNQSCGGGVMTESVDFTASAITMTTWLLPWLALIAQLPFQAKGWMNFLSGFLAVGSPALATYSLALTAFNRWHTFRKFQHLKKTVRNHDHARPELSYMTERIDAAAFILVEVQQCPMRANQRDGELASLIVVDEPRRRDFWKAAYKDLKNTRRGFTYSFLAQGLGSLLILSQYFVSHGEFIVLMAALAYLISFVGAVQDSVGLQFSASMVWSWMFPVVYGYIQVGSQYAAGCIQDALTDSKVIAVQRDDGQVHFVHQRGLCPNADLLDPSTGWIPRGNTDATVNPAAVDEKDSDESSTPPMKDRLENVPVPIADSPEHHPEYVVPPPTWCGFDVRGDERREGPLFNYARIFTWSAFAEHVHSGFYSAVKHLQNGAPTPSTNSEAALACGFEPHQNLTAYTVWAAVPPSTIHHMIGAACIALFLQWGTAGPAFYVAYQTPVIGIGCDSGSYLIYGVAATVSWVVLVFSSLLSHAYMQRIELDPHKQASSLLAGLAVLSRLLGKAIGIANAIWLVAFNVMQQIGTYDNCWCRTNAFSLHANGWALLFKSSAELRAITGDLWIGSFIWSVSICVVTTAFFAYRQRTM
ncbi:hypothetical protein FB45DRAFT_877247 [Roridomyces roridus]|uniref:Uncharacterized protein n=1 Tax=Roridomyces roridus TaxID=1738132 RepID=A0AAD7F8A7_9AGAR|nr:hypothetical protein FB45DRAFT_877247 [Roridomyces roridus]